ncbi:hypothetical protein C8R47DRAFT_1329506 [Mycena vitilis]|nr:hypothetical protein C8R47DRAFT_1329506 [Mycena vitilis]
MEDLPETQGAQLYMPTGDNTTTHYPDPNDLQLPSSYGGGNTNYYAMNPNGYATHYEGNGAGGPSYGRIDPVPQFYPPNVPASHAAEKENQQWPSLAEQVAAQVKAQVDSRMASLWEQMEERERLKFQRDTEEAAAAQSRTPVKVASAEIYTKVTETMQALLGMEDPKSKIPGPLASGDPCRVDENGVKLHNPTWLGKPDGSQALVMATVNVLWANETTCRTLSESEGPMDAHLKSRFKKAAIQHWCTKRTNYRAENTQAGADKKIAKTDYNRGHHRTKRLVASRRGEVPAFKAKYGAANCEGVEALLYTPWASLDGSEPGKADPEAWKARRKATGDKTANEQLHPEWRGGIPNRINAALDTLARQNEGNTAQHVQGGKDRRRGRSKKSDRFPCFPENKVIGEPAGKRIPWRSCVDPAWLAATAYDPLADPTEFTIFGLIIPDADLDEEALAMLL